MTAAKPPLLLLPTVARGENVINDLSRYKMLNDFYVWHVNARTRY